MAGVYQLFIKNHFSSYLEGWWHNQTIGNWETNMVHFYWFWGFLQDCFCSRTRLLSDRSRRPYHYNSQVIIHQNHRHHNKSAIRIIVAVITFIIPVILIIPMLMQVDLQGQPRAGTVQADPVEETRYRRFQLSPPSSSQLIPIRYQYYTRLQNQSGVNLDVLVSITHCQTVTIVIIVLLLIIVLFNK